MPKDKTPEDVYEELSRKGLYEEANLDGDEVKKVVRLCIEDFDFAQRLKKIEDPNWRVIFNIHYDVLRELCSQLMRFSRQKTSNHQGVFAFIILKHQELELEWAFFEVLRNMRNLNKYEGADISKDKWKSVEFKFEGYVKILRIELERRLKELDPQ